MSRFASLSYFDLAELFRKSRLTITIETKQWDLSYTWILVCLLVASSVGSGRLKHIRYHGVQRIVIMWSTVWLFFILNLKSPPVKYFTDRSKTVLLLWIFYVFVLSCVCYVFVRVCLYVLCGYLLGKG